MELREHGQDHPVLVAKDVLVKKGGRIILNVESFSLYSGEVVAIIGPNGAGKSTLLSVLAALEFPARGQLTYRGTEINRRNALMYRRQTAAVFQEPLLLDGSVLSNVVLGQTLRGKSQGAKENALTWLSRFGIEHLSSQMRYTLSGGEAQRASLARAFALEPEILMMDEPFSSVDNISRQGLIKVFKEVQTASRTTTLLVTHDFREVLALADRVLVLSDGKPEVQGSPEEIARHPVWKALAAADSY